MTENVEQEIWNDFKRLSESSLMQRLSYSSSNAHFGVSYDDKNSLIHNGLSKKLEYDEDFKINQFLLSADYKNVDWNQLSKLYPNWQPIELPKNHKNIYPPAKFRTHKERKDIENHLFNLWEDHKNKLHLKIPNNKIAKEYLIQMRWEESPVCPKCNNNKIYFLNNEKVSFKCPKCGLHFSEKVGTIFQGSKLELIKWYEAMYLLTGVKTSKLSSHQLANAIGVTQTTSWGMINKIQSKVNEEFINKIRFSLFK